MNKRQIVESLPEESIFLAMCNDNQPLLLNFDDQETGIILIKGTNSKKLLHLVFRNGVWKSDNYRFLYFGRSYFKDNTKEPKLKHYNISSYEDELEPYLLNLIETYTHKKVLVLLEDLSMLTNKVARKLPSNNNIRIACASRKNEDTPFYINSSAIWETEHDGTFTFGDGSVTFDLKENENNGL